jgi:hypothetical protein
MPPVTELDNQSRQMAELMTFGSEFAETITGVTIPADWPLSVQQVALVLGLKLRHARELADAPPFIGEINRLLRQRRASERARNLNVAVSIRDDVGENLAADKTA